MCSSVTVYTTAAAIAAAIAAAKQTELDASKAFQAKISSHIACKYPGKYIWYEYFTAQSMFKEKKMRTRFIKMLKKEINLRYKLQN